MPFSIFCLGSVLFRNSAYIGTKQASRVPTGSKQDNSPHIDDERTFRYYLSQNWSAQYKKIYR